MIRHLRRAAPVLLAVSAACAACAGVRAAGGEPGDGAAAAGVPGFDTRDYPGDDVMRTWRAESPYRWVGYYLPAPCYTGTTWTGRRDALRTMGWGFAMIFVGEQDWSVTASRDTTPAVENPRCTRANLTSAHGTEHARAAAAAAAADGFPRGSVIFLDVERVERVSAELTAYVRAWVSTLLEEGRFTPGLYAHDVNTPALYALFEQEFTRARRTDAPQLWVAKTAGFTLAQPPAASGYPVAAIWQGVLDTREAWGDAALMVDVNVARTADPSSGR